MYCHINQITIFKFQPFYSWDVKMMLVDSGWFSHSNLTFLSLLTGIGWFATDWATSLCFFWLCRKWTLRSVVGLCWNIAVHTDLPLVGTLNRQTSTLLNFSIHSFQQSLCLSVGMSSKAMLFLKFLSSSSLLACSHFWCTAAGAQTLACVLSCSVPVCINLTWQGCNSLFQSRDWSSAIATPS